MRAVIAIALALWAGVLLAGDYEVLYVYDVGETQGNQAGDVINMRAPGTQAWTDIERGLFPGHNGIRFKVATITVSPEEEADHVAVFGRTVRYVSQTASGPELIYIAVDDIDTPTAVTRKSRAL